MENIDRVLEKLLKGDLEQLTAEEKLYLCENLESEELQEFTEIIQQFIQLEEVEPDVKLKRELLTQFKSSKLVGVNEIEMIERTSSQFNIYKIAVAAVVVLVAGVGFYFSNFNSSNNTASSIDAEEFNQFTQLEEQEMKDDTLVQETKFLMSMDFFSNASVALEID